MLVVTHSPPGNLRRWRHRLMLGPAILAGWAWFGWLGGIPVLIWWWHVRPRGGPLERRLRLDPAAVRWARLGPLRILIGHGRGRADELFRDELTPREAARLRRLLAYRLSAGGRLEDVEPV